MAIIRMRKDRWISLLLGITVVIASLAVGYSLMAKPNVPSGGNSSPGGPIEQDPNGENQEQGADGESPMAEEGRLLLEAKDQGYLLLVNKNNPLLPAYKPDDLEPIKYYAAERSAASRFMRKEAAVNFHLMVEDAERAGHKIMMTTAFRDYDFQKLLFDNYVAKNGFEEANKFSAKPGQSEHQTGLAVDVTSPSVRYELTYELGNTEEGKWLAENCKNYGFILRYPEGQFEITGYEYEPWHFRYVGKTAAKLIYEEGLTLEEFLKNRSL